MTIAPSDQNVCTVEARRLSRQSAAILAAFRDSPGHVMTNGQLSAVAQRFGARLHDLRQAGHRIDLIEKCAVTGVTIYALRL